MSEPKPKRTPVDKFNAKAATTGMKPKQFAEHVLKHKHIYRPTTVKQAQATTKK